MRQIIGGLERTDAASSAVIRPVSFVAHATVRAQGVDAFAVLAQVGDGVAFVNVCNSQNRVCVRLFLLLKKLS